MKITNTPISAIISQFDSTKHLLKVAQTNGACSLKVVNKSSVITKFDKYSNPKAYHMDNVAKVILEYVRQGVDSIANLKAASIQSLVNHIRANKNSFSVETLLSLSAIARMSPRSIAAISAINPAKAGENLYTAIKTYVTIRKAQFEKSDIHSNDFQKARAQQTIDKTHAQAHATIKRWLDDGDRADKTRQQIQ